MSPSSSRQRIRAFKTPSAILGLALFGLFATAALVGPYLFGAKQADLDPAHARALPSLQHPFGTDSLGRDVLARVIESTGFSLGLAISATAIGAAVGILLATFVPLLGGRGRRLILRVANVATAFPALLSAVLVATLLGPSAKSAVIGIALAQAPGFLRLTVNLAGSIGNSDYVTAARASGVHGRHIFGRYLLRNMAEPLATVVMLSIASSVLSISALSFIGLGVRPPSYDWGQMLSEAIPSLYTNPMWAAAPTLAIVLAGLAFSLLEEPTSAILNPRSRRPPSPSTTESASPASDRDTGSEHATRPALHLAADTPSEDVLVSVSQLRITAPHATDRKVLVDNASLQVRRGEIVGIVGESGSGKSLTLLSIAGLLPPNTQRSSQHLTFDGEAIGRLDDAALRRRFGTRVALISQDPGSSLNPVLKIGTQLTQKLRVHQKVSRREARERAIAALEVVRINDPRRCLRQRPHQLSGGMRQRVLIAMGLLGDPDLILADEPTTALDVTIQAQVLEVLLDVHRRLGTAVVFVSHDLAVVSQICSRILVMKDGVIVEEGPAEQIINAPKHSYTQSLLQAVPSSTWQPTDGALNAERSPVPSKPGNCKAGESGDLGHGEKLPALMAKRIVVEYGGMRAIHGVDMRVDRGQMIGLVGESGSGKTTVARALAGLVPVAAGTIEVDGIRINDLPRRGQGSLHRRVQVVFQDPHSSLNPRATVGATVREVLVDNEVPVDPEEDARRLFDIVGLPVSMLDRYPFELSGGQRQRVAIARALASRPTVLIADEATSALDVTVQAAILDLLREVQRDMGMSLLFVSHNLDVVRELCEDVAVMWRGDVVERGPVAAVFERPEHNYTKELLAAIPRMGEPWSSTPDRASGIVVTPDWRSASQGFSHE